MDRTALPDLPDLQEKTGKTARTAKMGRAEKMGKMELRDHQVCVKEILICICILGLV